MTCRTCNRTNPDDARFCGGCGVSLSASTAIGIGVEPAELPMVGFGTAVKLGFQRYADVNGRSTRAEYWWWVLFFFGALFGIAVIDAFLTGGLLVLLFWLGVIIPHFALTIIRLHDINMTGW